MALWHYEKLGNNRRVKKKEKEKKRSLTIQKYIKVKRKACD